MSHGRKARPLQEKSEFHARSSKAALGLEKQSFGREVLQSECK
jgi:hypothetical protein